MAVELPAEERVRELTADPKLTAEEANRYGDLFVQAGKYPVAMMFFERSKDRERLGRVKKDAIRMGDAFLLHAITRLVPDLVEAAEWKEAGDAAHKEGKLLFARDCYEKAGDAARAAAVRDESFRVETEPPRGFVSSYCFTRSIRKFSSRFCSA
jgi:hypothetical protein